MLTSKWTTAWDHGVRDASPITHLQSFDDSMIVGGGGGHTNWRHLHDTLVIILNFHDDLPQSCLKACIFGHPC